ncbi:uncharacterized protein LTR77_000524 [Saxophila tyrrhenica]|uniref:Uncharacterized protein n=1 Tax=Saxophila tyrrhenica TaxID=1690608 RepID=A0AAV9PSS3_9PEZI|nr:hypothetical protein LTR77_000524 [Saxophila tyrrhenica]
MSDQNHYDQSQGGHNQNLPSSNPWSQQPSYGSAPNQQQQQQQPQQPQQPQQQYAGYAPPSGPPPGQQPQRAGTFKESDFVPESERGEQREAIQQYEMSKTGNESQQDRDVEQLQREFPGVDGSLISALYNDNGGLAPTRDDWDDVDGYERTMHERVNGGAEEQGPSIKDGLLPLMKEANLYVERTILSS